MNGFLLVRVTAGHGDMSKQSSSSCVLRIPSHALEMVGWIDTLRTSMSSLITTYLSWGLSIS
jgi:hypothetical protein